MSTMTAENILPLITQLSQPERAKLRILMDQQEQQENDWLAKPQLDQPAKPPLDKRLPPKPMPSGGAAALQWISEHRREFAGQWVALDGDRLIAHSFDRDEVWAASQADGAYLPMVTFVEDPDHIVHIIWA